jgi:dihydrofolate reductase
MESIDGLLMGRGTFETALSFEAWPFKKPVVVASRTLSASGLRKDIAGKVRISPLAPGPLMEKLAAEGWNNVYVDGGKLIQSFLNEGLISDLILTRVPLLLGGGLSLFGTAKADITLRHVRTTTFASGMVQSKYDVTY